MRTLPLLFALLLLPIAAEAQVKDSLVIRFKSGDSVKIAFDKISSIRFHTLVSDVERPSPPKPTPAPYPNPSAGKVTVSFTIEKPQEIRLEILSIDGVPVATLVQQCYAGAQTLHWNGLTDRGGEAPSGSYVYRFVADGVERHGKLTLRR